MPRLLQRMLRPPRRAIPTRAGLFVLATPFVLGMAAVTSANNLLFIMVGASLGAIVVSGILSERNVRGISARVEPVSAAHAGEPARLRVLLSRPPSRAAAYGLTVRERYGRPLRLFGRRPPELLDAMIPVIDGVEAEALAERTFDRRGRAMLGRCELTSTYPFSLLTKACDLDVELDVLVRPRRIPVPPLLADPRAIAADGDTADRRGAGLDVFGLRERRDGDALHRLHALRSLSLGQDVVVETAGIDRPTAWIGVANDEGVDPTALERAIEAAASALVEWHRRGYVVGLSTAGERHPPGARTLDQLLDRLALLAPARPVDDARPGPSVWLVPAGGRARGRSITVDSEGGLSAPPVAGRAA